MSSAAQSKQGEGQVKFGPFDVSTQVFARNEVAVALVNIKPIVPGHVLVIPIHPTPLLSDLPPQDIAPFWTLVHQVSSFVKHIYTVSSSTSDSAGTSSSTSGSALTIGVQDGTLAGQSVPHLHVHILPRREGDFAENDEIYTHLEAFGMSLFKRQKSLLEPAGVKAEVKENQAKQSERGLDASSTRTERSLEEMQKEARWLERKWDEGDWNREE
ncbi:HIT-like protein [Ceraceosorus guamensis]|uniref:HIT-like protein n=1 Tax=Ceraceosorus guamensis TaxID=1522189 RepID=A0A316W9Q7_9BASI|nr:HIT-like protein [Ceraceosorus guamensis]PWN44733.1 HIT-like protein [Ceraceosorus guamensis]